MWRLYPQMWEKKKKGNHQMWQKYNHIWCWYCLMWGWYYQIWGKKKGTAKYDKNTIIYDVGIT